MVAKNHFYRKKAVQAQQLNHSNQHNQIEDEHQLLLPTFLRKTNTNKSVTALNSHANKEPKVEFSLAFPFWTQIQQQPMQLKKNHVQCPYIAHD